VAYPLIQQPTESQSRDQLQNKTHLHLSITAQCF